jgi:hypothetical protein
MFVVRVVCSDGGMEGGRFFWVTGGRFFQNWLSLGGLLWDWRTAVVRASRDLGDRNFVTRRQVCEVRRHDGQAGPSRADSLLSRLASSEPSRPATGLSRRLFHSPLPFLHIPVAFFRLPPTALCPHHRPEAYQIPWPNFYRILREKDSSAKFVGRCFRTETAAEPPLRCPQILRTNQINSHDPG